MSRWLVGSSSRSRSGPADHGLGQEHAAFHAGGKGRYVRVRRKAHPRDDSLDLLMHPPAAVGLQSVLDSAQFGLQGRRFPRWPIGSPSDGTQPATPPWGRIPALPRRRPNPRRSCGTCWGSIAVRRPCWRMISPPIGLHAALEEAEERRLAGAVAAQEADALAGLDRQIGLVQERQGHGSGG